MKYWNKSLRARQGWYKLKLNHHDHLMLLNDQIAWIPFKDTPTYKRLKYELQQFPSNGRFYISQTYIYFELLEDYTWYILKYSYGKNT